MADTLANALDRRIRDIFQSAYATAARFAEAFKAETGEDHPLINGSSNTTTKSSAKAARPPKAGRKKRERRTLEALAKEALDIVEFVRAQGKEGADGNSIRLRFPKVGQSIKVFVKKYGKVNVQTKGAGMVTRYFVTKE